MKGIKYVIDENENKTAVVIDLKEHGDVWEDFYDTQTALKRAKEPRESLESVKRALKKAGKLK